MKEKNEQAAQEETNKVEMVQLPLNLINQTLQYLATRPYSEVAGIIADIQQNHKTV